MLWMPMAGQSVWAAGAMFMQMWAVMTFIMMSPVIAVSLWRDWRRDWQRAWRRDWRHDWRRDWRHDWQRDWRRGEPRNSRGGWAGTAAGYFLVWMLCGLPVYAVGAAVMSAGLQSGNFARFQRLLTAATLLGGALYQLSAFKLRRLQRCCASRNAWGDASPWRYGMRLGVECVLCCAGLTAMMLALGSMDARLMAVFGMAMLAERSLRGREHWARGIGVIALLSAGFRVAALAAG